MVCSHIWWTKHPPYHPRPWLHTATSMLMSIQYHTSSGHNRTQQNHPEDVQKATRRNIFEQQQSHERLTIYSHESLRHQRSSSAIGTPQVTTFIIIRERHRCCFWFLSVSWIYPYICECVNARHWLCRMSFIKFTPLTCISSRGRAASSNMMVPSTYV